MKSLLLAQNTWDLTCDASGNIAVCSDPYALAQNIATKCRLFLGELWFDTTQGIPYFQLILGKLPPAQVVRQLYIQAAESVTGIASANMFFSSFNKRILAGQIQAISDDGTPITVTTSNLQGTTPWYVVAASPQALGSLSGGP